MAENNEKSGKRGWRVDQFLLTAFIWGLPLSLFGYVGFRITEASGTDPYDLIPQVPVWQVAVWIALVVSLVTALVMARSVAARKESPGGRGRWDSYNSPFQSKQ